MTEATQEAKTETIERDFDKRTYEKPEGTFKTLKLADLKDNPNRAEEVFVWNEDKIEGLIESYLATGFQSTMEATQDKWKNFFLAGGGHHRKKALNVAIERGLGDRIRGLFKDDDGNWCIRIVVKKYTKEEMLRAFMLENADAWGRDDQQNQAMMAIQIKSYLDGKLREAKTVEDFIASVNSPYPLKMDSRAFTRTKNAGAGGSLMVQYLGPNTWSRSAIDLLLKVLYDNGEVSDQYRELAEKLPNVTMAFRFKQLMTEVDEEGDKVKASKDDQDKALKLVETHQLTRADIEEANKIKEAEGLNPIEALDTLIGKKKEEIQGDKPKSKEKDQKKIKPPEAALNALKNAYIASNTMVGKKEKWSKAQAKEAKSVFEQLAGNMKTILSAK